eukprot:GILI01014261.1.p1 GENE.GILI01014261.1~~GILI01014261.1.p1  ORF type:complete len:195 (+),score=36.36 GILI01014261.1:88-585(+)
MDLGQGQVDVVIGADCLFLPEYHSHLLDLLDFLLAPDGCLLAFAPQRKGSLDRFACLAEEQGKWTLSLTQRYDERVWGIHRNFLKMAGLASPTPRASHARPAFFGDDVFEDPSASASASSASAFSSSHPPSSSAAFAVSSAAQTQPLSYEPDSQYPIFLRLERRH